jgi:hypothetical protein
MAEDKYKTHVKDRIETIRAWKRMGLTDKEICENLGVGVSNFSKYKGKHKELKGALKTGKDDADAQVESALFRRAIGYEYDEVSETVEKNSKGKLVLVSRKIVKKFLPPDNIAIIFYLKNRKSKDWHDRKQTEIGGMDGKPLPNVHFILPDNRMDEDDD